MNPATAVCSICPIPVSLQRIALWEDPPSLTRQGTIATMDASSQVYQTLMFFSSKEENKKASQICCLPSKVIFFFIEGKIITQSLSSFL